MNAWLFQDSRQKKRLGEKAPWSVGWYDPEGKKRSKRIGSKSMAQKYRRKIEGELAAGTYQINHRKTWASFKDELESRIAPQQSPQNWRCTTEAMAHFKRLVSPTRMDKIKTQTIDDYIAKRSLERGRNKKSKVSPATVNKELRHLKTVLRIANEWGYLPAVPKIRMMREPRKLPRFVTAGHFADIYNACDKAKYPANQPYSPGAWWQAILMFAYMTGWRISEITSLRRDDLDMDAGQAVTRAADNKGKRDEMIPLHAVVIEHLRQIPSFETLVFPWNGSRELLWVEFRRIQELAGVHLDCHESHEHTDACHVYGFHDLRRAFATVNAPNLSAEALQRLMRHQSYTTTQRYIDYSSRLREASDGLTVPVVAKQG